MSEYVIARVGSRDEFERLIAAPGGYRGLELGCEPWGGAGRPRTFARVCHDGGALHVCMRSYEREIRAAVHEYEGKIHTDSCMEFFFSPCPQEDCGYFNMEMNPLGYLRFDYGAGRAGRVRVDYDPADFRIWTAIDTDAGAAATGGGAYWQVVYSIPFSLIREYAPAFTGAPGAVIRGNFYKCGELSPCPHFRTWNAVDSRAYPEPDFHRPEYFGSMRLA